MKRLWHTQRMPLVWDIFHAPMNAEGGQLTWCWTTGNMEEDHSFLFLKKNLMKIFFFFEFEKLKYFEGIENFDFFFLKNLEILNFFKELKILIDFFFFFWKIKKSWSFEGIWKFLLKICSLEIFLLEYGFGDFSFEKWRIFLLKMEIFFFFFFWLKKLSFEWEQLWLEVNVDCWISPWLNSYKKIISISNGFIHWNELEVVTQCP